MAILDKQKDISTLFAYNNKHFQFLYEKDIFFDCTEQFKNIFYHLNLLSHKPSKQTCNSIIPVQPLKLVLIIIFYQLGPPYVHPIPELRAVVGREFSFMCPASGYPIDRISWAKGKTLYISHLHAMIS